MHTPYFFIGIIQKAHGLEGELILNLELHNLNQPTRLYVYRQGSYVPYFVQKWQAKEGRIWTKLMYITTRTEAIQLRGHKAFIEKKELPSDVARYQQMVGTLVKDINYGPLGKVLYIYPRKLQPCLVIDYKNTELWIPLDKAFIKNIDEKSIMVDLPSDYLPTMVKGTSNKSI